MDKVINITQNVVLQTTNHIREYGLQNRSLWHSVTFFCYDPTHMNAFNGNYSTHFFHIFPPHIHTKGLWECAVFSSLCCGASVL